MESIKIKSMFELVCEKVEKYQGGSSNDKLSKDNTTVKIERGLSQIRIYFGCKIKDQFKATLKVFSNGTLDHLILELPDMSFAVSKEQEILKLFLSDAYGFMNYIHALADIKQEAV